jgi:hypothetical protein
VNRGGGQPSGGPKWWNRRKTKQAARRNWAEKQKWAVEWSFQFKQGFGFKIQRFNTLKPNLNWSQTKIILNKSFEYFSNLELLKISLNIQIQTKALNGGFLK